MRTETAPSSATPSYTGRFAPSPTGALHQGSLVAALASYLDAKVHRGQWLVRIEDLDWDRNVAGADSAILASLQRCGMHWDGDVTWQSERRHLYQRAAQQLGAALYPCACSRREIVDSRLTQGSAAAPGAAAPDAAAPGAAAPDAAAPGAAAPATSPSVYAGTCRNGLAPGKTARALRLRVPDGPHAMIAFTDRWHGHIEQDLAGAVGDFVVKRADGFWAYQLAVVVDDGVQGITHIVRGADLLDSTPRQLYLQRLLGLPQPAYLHVPVVNNALGEKLSKQTGAQAFDSGADPACLLKAALLPAARFLGLDFQADNLDAFWRRAVPAWARLLAQR